MTIISNYFVTKGNGKLSTIPTIPNIKIICLIKNLREIAGINKLTKKDIIPLTVVI